MIETANRPAHVELIREAVHDLCSRFPVTYWRELDRHDEYPTEFVTAMTEAGWLAALIPEEYGACCSCWHARRHTINSRTRLKV